MRAGPLGVAQDLGPCTVSEDSNTVATHSTILPHPTIDIPTTGRSCVQFMIFIRHILMLMSVATSLSATILLFDEPLR